jgi:hypothetical protein
MILPRHLLLSTENIKGIRMFFFAIDPKYRFTDAIKEQISKNRNYDQQDDVYDSDEDIDDIGGKGYNKDDNWKSGGGAKKKKRARAAGSNGNGQEVFDMNEEDDEDEEKTAEDTLKEKIVRGRKRERAKGDEFFNGKTTKAKKRYITIRDTVEQIYRTVTDFQKIGIWLFDRQLGISLCVTLSLLVI